MREKSKFEGGERGGGRGGKKRHMYKRMVEGVAEKTPQGVAAKGEEGKQGGKKTVCIPFHLGSASKPSLSL